MSKREVVKALSEELEALERDDPDRTNGSPLTNELLALRNRLAEEPSGPSLEFRASLRRQMMLAVARCTQERKPSMRERLTTRLVTRATALSVAGMMLAGTTVGASAALGGPNLPEQALNAVGLGGSADVPEQSTMGITNAPDAAVTGMDNADEHAFEGAGNAMTGADDSGTVEAPDAASQGINNAPEAAEHGKSHANDHAFDGSDNAGDHAGGGSASATLPDEATKGIGNAPDAAANGKDHASEHASNGANNSDSGHGEPEGAATSTAGLPSGASPNAGEGAANATEGIGNAAAASGDHAAAQAGEGAGNAPIPVSTPIAAAGPGNHGPATPHK